MNEFDLSGKIAVVTGASRGIGASIARALDRAGANVALVARDAAALGDVASGLEHRSVCVQADLSDPDVIPSVATRVSESLGDAHILVNNSAANVPGSVGDLDGETWDHVNGLNVRAPFLLAQAFAPPMIERRWGKVINVGSMVSFVGDSHASPYITSKAAVLGLTRALAVEWASHGITVNALCPGWIETEMTAPLQADERFDRRVTRSVPMRRWGRPEDLDAAVMFLAGPGSDFMTGQSLVVDGGLLASW